MTREREIIDNLIKELRSRKRAQRTRSEREAFSALLKRADASIERLREQLLDDGKITEDEIEEARRRR